MRIVYAGKDWRFIEGYSFLIDGERFHLNATQGEMKRDHDTRIWEWCVFTAPAADESNDVVRVVRALSACKDATVFYHGDQYREEHKLALGEILSAASIVGYLDSR